MTPRAPEVRCNDPFSAIRCLTIAGELHKHRGVDGLESAADWFKHLLELSILTPNTHALMVERLAVVFSHEGDTGPLRWSMRGRKAAFFRLLCTSTWLAIEETQYEQESMRKADVLYGNTALEAKRTRLWDMQPYWDEIRDALDEAISKSALET